MTALATGLNARGEGDFYSGLAPACTAADDLTRELGDPKEASLATALHYIRFGRCPGSRPPPPVRVSYTTAGPAGP